MLFRSKNYIEADHERNQSDFVKRNEVVASYVADAGLVVHTETVDRGPVGQTYPRLFLYLGPQANGERIVKEMYERGIYIGFDKGKHALYISPLNLTEKEADIVGKSLKEVLEHGD